MHAQVFYIAALWMTVLLVVSTILIIRARSVLSRVLALDMAILVLIALLVLFSDANRVAFYLDAALMLALLSVVATIAAARYHATGRLFR
jgi:multicomponent Na+:H+ antiporter subunit F